MFTPFESFDIKFRNQILAPPTKENLANHRGIVTGEMIRHYSALAKQGVGTMLTESAFVARQGKMAAGQLGISEEEHLEGLEKLAKAMILLDFGTISMLFGDYLGGHTVIRASKETSMEEY